MDWLIDNIGKITVGLVILIVALISWYAWAKSAEKAAFMAACLADHKQYECDVLWGQASPPQQVLPIFIPIR